MFNPMFNRILGHTITIIALTGCGRPVTQHWGATVDDSGTAPEVSAPYGPGLEWMPEPDERVTETSGYSLALVDDLLFLDGIIDQDRTPGFVTVGSLYSESGQEVLTVKVDDNYFGGSTTPMVGDVNGDGRYDMLFQGSDPDAADWAMSSGFLAATSPFEGGVLTLGADDFEPSDSAIGILNGRLVPIAVENSAWLDNFATGDLNGDGVKEAVATDGAGGVWFITDTDKIAMASTPSGMVTALRVEDLNRDGFDDLLINNLAEDVGLERGLSAQTPQIFQGPIDPLNPPAWTDGAKAWPAWDLYAEDGFIPQGVIGALPPLADGTVCWLASGYTWVTESGVNSALAEICTQAGWTPRVLITAPSNAAAWFDNRNTLIVGDYVVTTLFQAGPMNPNDHYRRSSGVFRWRLSTLLGR